MSLGADSAKPQENERVLETVSATAATMATKNETVTKAKKAVIICGSSC